MIARSNNLAVIPQVVSEVLRLTDDPYVGSRALEQTIEREPGVSAKLLRVASSAYYGGQPVPSISRAIGVLGMNTIRSLVVSVAYHQNMSAKPQAACLDKVEFWKHSLAVATTARVLGKLKNPGLAEELYCAGLMHDVGILILDRFCPDLLDMSYEKARSLGIPLHVAEQDVMGFDHAVVGALLAKRWGLSPLLESAIRCHHSLADADHLQTNAFIALADHLAHQSGCAGFKGLAGATLDPDVLTIVDLPEAQLEIIAKVVEAEVIRAQDAFQIRAAA